MRSVREVICAGWWLVAGGWWLVAGGWWLVGVAAPRVARRLDQRAFPSGMGDDGREHLVGDAATLMAGAGIS
ncbi:hypothetical protein [Phaeobacter porticola]|uniref:hypothetical protein n=1 Tax=Phaeobacter porticola TaxID=1844006 RepID=UPI0012FF6B7F|nr:hypothetical protein [Phaeobacter porticola]